MKDYAASAMELAPRDIVARAIQTEINEGRGIDNEYVNLDLTHLGPEKINERLPGIWQIAMDFAGVDIIETPIPVQPGQHYSMGGVDCDKDCKTPIIGLYAAGEAACVSVHGANRLGGNSLLETMVFGKIAGKIMARDIEKREYLSSSHIRKALEKENLRIEDMMGRHEGEPVYKIRDELKAVMVQNFGVFRNEDSMSEGLIKIKDLKSRFENIKVGSTTSSFNHSLIHALELESMLIIAEPLALGALHRRESRGSHFRPDYPDRDDDGYLAHTLCYLLNGQIILDLRPVTLGSYPVKERVY
jgi:succinate dehydrogenase / fumarate reductase flavoprotein subunit